MSPLRTYNGSLLFGTMNSQIKQKLLWTDFLQLKQEYYWFQQLSPPPRMKFLQILASDTVAIHLLYIPMHNFSVPQSPPQEMLSFIFSEVWQNYLIIYLILILFPEMRTDLLYSRAHSYVKYAKPYSYDYDFWFSQDQYDWFLSNFKIWNVSDTSFYAVLYNHFLFLLMSLLKYSSMLRKYISFPSIILFSTGDGREVVCITDSFLLLLFDSCFDSNTFKWAH